MTADPSTTDVERTGARRRRAGVSTQLRALFSALRLAAGLALVLLLVDTAPVAVAVTGASLLASQLVAVAAAKRWIGSGLATHLEVGGDTAAALALVVVFSSAWQPQVTPVPVIVVALEAALRLGGSGLPYAVGSAAVVVAARLAGVPADIHPQPSSTWELTGLLVVVPLMAAAVAWAGAQRDAALAELAAHSAEVDRANLELQQMNVSLQRFAGVIAHDIRSPMSLVVSTLELLCERADGLTPRQHGLLETARRRAARCVDLTAVLLHQTRLLTTHVARETVPLGAVVADALDQLAGRIDEVHPKIEVAPMPPVVGNHVLLLQVFQNVLSNALRYRSDHDVCRIDVGCEVDGDDVIVTFADNGPGIPEREREHVFRFGVTSGGEGTGIGLATAAMIVAAHGGDIRADESALGGAAIVVRLPLAAEPERTIDLPEPVGTAPSGPGGPQ